MVIIDGEAQIETPDVATSSDDYASRFSGAVGAWFLAEQERATLDLLGLQPGDSVLDVGGGHGQLAGPLAEAGYTVTVLGSDASCGQRIANLVQAGRCRFEQGNLLQIPFPDRSFDAVIAFRLISHLQDWQRLLGEMARVARQVLIVEYPELISVNLVSAATWRLKRAVEGNTRPFTCFRRRTIVDELQRLGWQMDEFHAEFFLPMVLHRVVGCVEFSSRAEQVCRSVGLTCRWGSPVLLKAERKRG